MTGYTSDGREGYDAGPGIPRRYNELPLVGVSVDRVPVWTSFFAPVGLFPG
jgi:hypothetical protein